MFHCCFATDVGQVTETLSIPLPVKLSYQCWPHLCKASWNLWIKYMIKTPRYCWKPVQVSEAEQLICDTTTICSNDSAGVWCDEKVMKAILSKQCSRGRLTVDLGESWMSWFSERCVPAEPTESASRCDKNLCQKSWMKSYSYSI